MGYLLFLISYGFEASIRKYLFSTAGLILFKYIFLLKIKFKKYIFNYSLFLLFLVVPLLIHSLLKEEIGNGILIIYDLISIFLAPILILTIFTNERMGSYKVAKTFLYVVVLIGFLNAVLTIVQSLIDPLAALNISVAQDYSGHNFGDSYKVNGLFAIPNYSISISSILSIWYLRDFFKGNKFFSIFSYIIELIIISSSLFNLVSRSYFIFTFLPYMFIFINYISSLIINFKIKIKAFIFLIVVLFSLLVFLNRVTNWEKQSTFFTLGFKRYQAESIYERISSYYSGLLNIHNVPTLEEAPGLGKTVGSKGRNNIAYLDSIKGCYDTGKEWDYSRLLCISGFYGYILILFCRLVPVLYLINIKNSLYDKNIHKSASLGLTIVAFFILLQAQFQFNDILAGMLCISLTSNTIYNLENIKTKRSNFLTE